MSRSEHYTTYRVLVITGWYPSALEPSNADFVREQIALLRDAGMIIDLIYADLNISYTIKGPRYQREELSFDKRGNMDAILSGPFWPKNQKWGLNRWIKRYHNFSIKVLSQFRTVDYHNIIHAHTYLGGAVANELSKSLDIPYIITEHYTGWLDDSIKSFHSSLGKRSLHEADEIIGVSPALQEKLEEQSQRPVICVPNFIDVDFFKPTMIPHNDIFHYIGVGDLSDRKNWKELILAFSKLKLTHPKSKLTIAGEGPLREDLQTLIQAHSLSPSVSLIGHLDRLNLLELYQQSQVLVHTSKTETFGLAIAEALSCGLPVITYPNPAAGYLIQNKNLGVILERHAKEELERAMIDIQDQFSNYDPIIISQSISARFSVDVWREKMEKVYDVVIKKNANS